MKAIRVLAPAFVCVLGIAVLSPGQQGPNNDSSTTVARPRRPSSNNAPGNPGAAAPAEAEQPKIPSKFGKAKEGDLPSDVPTFSTDAITVTVDTAVVDNKGHFIPNVPKNYFRVLEDGVPQQVSGFSTGEAPMTIAMVVEFSNRFQQFYSWGWFQTLAAAYGFVQTLKPEDYLAVIAYDLRTEILSDFTIDRAQTADAMNRLRIAGFSEANMFDAVVDTAQRMQDIEGRKAILLISSGIDTFSRLTYDKARRALQDAGVPVYTLGLLQAQRDMADGFMGPGARMDFLQADNTLRTFASETGGMSFFPHFDGEMPSIFRAIAQTMRSEYVLTYTPSNQARDGKVRRIKVQLINPETNEPLRINDDKGKPIKYQIVAKNGYTAPRAVE
ncbi:MAG TPA: VWA domain-containing protein [Bryobacteraceae bacterium]|nr:VWA domain-containing protein [Bryobacteraceae bacterium]